MTAKASKPLLSDCLRSALFLIAVIAVAGCSRSDLASMEISYPDLSDIPAAPNSAETEAGDDTPESATDPATIIEALIEEAETRKSEGYQPPATE